MLSSPSAVTVLRESSQARGTLRFQAESAHSSAATSGGPCLPIGSLARSVGIRVRFAISPSLRGDDVPPRSLRPRQACAPLHLFVNLSRAHYRIANVVA